MKNDFISLFKAIEPTEQKIFERYIKVFYGQQASILAVFKQVLKDISTENTEGVSLTEPNPKNTLNALSDLKKWLLEFLTIQEVKSNSYEAKFLMLEALRKRGLKEVWEKKSKLLNQELMEHPSPDIWLTFLKLRLAHTDYFNTEIDKMKDYQEQMTHLLDELDNLYIGTKLKYSAELQSRTNILQENYSPRLLNEILVLIETDDSINPVIKNLYAPLLQLIKDKSEAAYTALKSFLITDKVHDRSEKLAVLLYLFNFAAYRIRQGDKLYHQECFALAEIGLNQSLFTAAGYFPTSSFNNIVNFGCHLHEFEWSKAFVKKWSVKLKPDDKEVATNLALARIDFESKDFEASIKLLTTIVHNKNIAFALNARILLARAYYENDVMYDTQSNHCEALYLYIYRSKSMGTHIKESSMNFVKILRLLVNNKPKKQLNALFDDMKESPIICYDWLKAKIAERKF